MSKLAITPDLVASLNITIGRSGQGIRENHLKLDASLTQFNQEQITTLNNDTTPLGQMLCAHLMRQIASIDEIADELKANSFGPETIKAAVLASDMTKFRPLHETLELVQSALDSGRLEVFNSSITQQQIDQGESLSGNDAFLVNLYLHSVAGAEKALQILSTQLIRDGIPGSDAVELALSVVIHQVGHDSFALQRGGFGSSFLLKKVATLLKGKVQYPTPLTAEGFLVEILDRREATLVPTMIRYIMEKAMSHPSLPDIDAQGASLTREQKAKIVPTYEFDAVEFAKIISSDTYGNMRQLQSIVLSIESEIKGKLSCLIAAAPAPQEEITKLQALLDSTLLQKFRAGIEAMPALFAQAGIHEFDVNNLEFRGYMHQGEAITTLKKLNSLLLQVTHSHSLTDHTQL